MKITLHRCLLLVSLSTTLAADDPNLPLCPTNIQYFPQNLPMHCRMPKNPGSFPNLPQYPTLPPLPEFFPSPSPDKQPNPVPIPVPPFPGMPMPGPMGGPMPVLTGPMPMPMPMMGGPPQKLPVIVMPIYSPDNLSKKPRPSKPHKKKKKKKKPQDSDTDTSSSDTSSDDSSSSSEHGFWKERRMMIRRFNKRHRMKKKEKQKKNKDLLTPILQYVTKDGYVIFEKKISKDEAKDWLKPTADVRMKEEKHRENPEEKLKEKKYEFSPKSAEDFLKLDEEDKRLKAMQISKETTGIVNERKVTTKKGKRPKRLKKVNALIKKTN